MMLSWRAEAQPRLFQIQPRLATHTVCPLTI